MKIVELVDTSFGIFLVVAAIFSFLWSGIFWSAVISKENKMKYKKLHANMFWIRVLIGFIAFIFMILIMLEPIFVKYFD